MDGREKQDEVKQSLPNQNPVEHLGEYGVNGGPGRPKGSKNKFTQIKHDFVEVWQEENGKERFRELFKGDKRDFLKALEMIVSILPKESMEEINKDREHTGIVVSTKDGRTIYL